MADRVQRQLKIDHALCGCEYFFDENTGKIDHFNLLPSDEEGKVDFMRLLTKEYGVSPQECVFIGDGMNDIHLAKAVSLSIAFNAQRALRDVADIVIDQPTGKEDFYAVAKKIKAHYSKKLTPL